MARPPRTESQLQAAGEHFAYELSMLAAVTHAFIDATPRDQWLTNALLESFAIHFRSIVDFFWPGPNVKPDDVLAVDFVVDPDVWAETIPAISPALQAARIRAHKEIAHLTYARLDVVPGAKAWDIGALVSDLGPTICRFYQHVPAGRLPSTGWGGA